MFCCEVSKLADCFSDAWQNDPSGSKLRDFKKSCLPALVFSWLYSVSGAGLPALARLFK